MRICSRIRQMARWKNEEEKNWSLSISRHHAIQCAITRDFQAKNKEIAKSLIFFEHAFFSGAELSAVRDCAKSDLRQRVTRLASSCRQVTHNQFNIYRKQLICLTNWGDVNAHTERYRFLCDIDVYSFLRTSTRVHTVILQFTFFLKI